MVSYERAPGRSGKRCIAVLAMMLMGVLAGCLGDDPADSDADNLIDGLDAIMDANNTTAAAFNESTVIGSHPGWKIGQWWGHHTFMGPEDTTGTHYNAVVVSADSGYEVATSADSISLADAFDDWFTLGTFDASLGTTSDGTAWSWYQWPLAVGNTWTQQFGFKGNVHDLTMSVGFSDTIQTAQGNMAGYTVTGTTDDGITAVTYDYVPELGWFAELFVYDPAASDPSAFAYHIINMGFGYNKTGPFQTYTVAPAIQFSYTLGNASDPASGAPQGDNQATFDVPADTNRLFGNVRIAGENAHATFRIEDPEGSTATYELTTPAGPGTKEETVDLSAPAAGSWSVTFLGIGAHVSSMLDLWTITEVSGELTAADFA